VSTHARAVDGPHSVSGDAHTRPQRLDEQTLPVGQRLPHMPQLAVSVASDTHRPLHTVCPVGHDERHEPVEHTWPLVHATPHAPQLAGSLSVSRHVPLQFC
jgi:hypothetical protein